MLIADINLNELGLLKAMAILYRRDGNVNININSLSDGELDDCGILRWHGIIILQEENADMYIRLTEKGLGLLSAI